MTQTVVEHDTKLPDSEESLEWDEISASLAKLEAGLHQAQADLGRMRADAEALGTWLDQCGDEKTRQ